MIQTQRRFGSLFLALIFCFSINLKATEPRLIQFSGYVLTADSLMGVAYSHVTILNKGRVAMAGVDGFFSFAAHEGDTLYFTSLGFKPAVYIMPYNLPSDKYSVVQLMTKTEYYLKETIIYPWGDKDGFKLAFKELRLPDDNLERAKKNMERERLAALGQKLEYDGTEVSNQYMRSQAAKFYYFGQNPPQNIFNPLAWAQFIQAWKRGDFQRKQKSDSGDGQ